MLQPQAGFDLAVRLRTAQGAPLGEVFSFLSSLYFRGKLTYARRFAVPPPGIAGAWVITPHLGLVTADTRIDVSALRAFEEVDIHPQEPRYTRPLKETAEALRERLGPDCEVVLLGSVASGKYVEPLQPVFGQALRFPPDFVGRGDMSRGGVLLRAARCGVELAYGPLAGATLRGRRPPRLDALAFRKPQG